MGVTTTQTNKPFSPRGNDQSPLAFNRAKLYSGKALDFDGVNDYVDLNGFTMAGNVATICFYAQFDNDGYLLDLNPNRLVIKNHDTQGFQIYNNNAWTTYDTTDMDTMGLYVVVSDGTTQRVYYNGHQLSGDKIITAIDFSAIVDFKLGSYHQTGSPHYNGKIAGFKIFNTALTPAQVADLYNNPEKVVPTGVDNTALKLFLPMQEGAGTTAYDGSGNGNHGTISGATYTHGIGAPVSQTAVISWNKGTNLLKYSEQIDNAVYTTGGGSGHSVTITANHGTAPDGTQTADRVQITRGSSYAELFQRTTTSMVAGEDYVLSFYAKSLSGTPTLYTAWNDDYLNEVTFTTDWVRYEYQYQYITHGQGSGLNLVTWTSLPTTSTSADLLVWGVQLEKASSVGAYIPNHTNTAITSEVLLPQGLTTGRDITGVNLFENVRKQGALNLDGNSWAEVHDNESLDITDAITLETWVYWDGTASDDGILGRWGNLAADRCYMLYGDPNKVYFYISSASIFHEGMATGWRHIVGTYDKINTKLYIDGQQEASSTAISIDIPTSSKNLEIGTYRYGGSRNYKHPIAQPRIYNRALTAEEVQRNYNAGKNIYTN